MSKVNELTDLLDAYARTCKQQGTFTAFLSSVVNPAEQIIVTEQLAGVNKVCEVLREAIISYADPEPNEQDVLEKLMGL